MSFLCSSSVCQVSSAVAQERVHWKEKAELDVDAFSSAFSHSSHRRKFKVGEVHSDGPESDRGTLVHLIALLKHATASGDVTSCRKGRGLFTCSRSFPTLLTRGNVVKDSLHANGLTAQAG